MNNIKEAHWKIIIKVFKETIVKANIKKKICTIYYKENRFKNTKQNYRSKIDKKDNKIHFKKEILI